MRLRMLVAVLPIGLWSAGCAGEPLSGPPELRIGRDSCAECGMLIADDRSAGAMLVDRESRQEYLHFDDIGCMLDMSADPERVGVVIEAYVHDQETREWIPAEAATYVLADPSAIRTPMGSGIAAFRSREKAEQTAASVRGASLDSASVAEARKAERARLKGAASEPDGRP